MSRNDEHVLGCEACKMGAYGGTWPPPDRLSASAVGPTFLHRCALCGTYWEFDLRFANPISEVSARSGYPAAFDR
jgi:hypothetical protein